MTNHTLFNYKTNNMKIKTFLLINLLFSGVSFSQVGINTDNPKATLDIVASPENTLLVDPINTCTTGNYNENAFLFASDPNTLEYDNLISSYRSTIAKQQDGNYLVWGQSAKPNTYGEHLYEPTLISPENGLTILGKF